MTREEKIAILKDIIDGEIIHPQVRRDVGIWAVDNLKAEPCEDAVSREQAIKQCGFGMTSLLVADCLRRLPPVTPKQKTGKWINNHTQCSICEWGMEDDVVGSAMMLFFPYCPNCGAKMEGVSE